MSKIINTRSKGKKSSLSRLIRMLESQAILKPEWMNWKCWVWINLSKLGLTLKLMKVYSPDTRSLRYLLSRVHSEGLCNEEENPTACGCRSNLVKHKNYKPAMGTPTNWNKDWLLKALISSHQERIKRSQARLNITI